MIVCENRPMDSNHPLTDKQRDVLQAVKEGGPGWHSRTNLGADLSKNKLNPAVIIVLDMLAATEKIEKELRQGTHQHISR
jgi:hypothetical protein